MNDKLLHDLLDDKSVWIRFSQNIKSKNINSKVFPYYKNHIQRFLYKAQNTTVEKLTVQRVITYLNSFTKTTSLEDWQVNQAIDAIHIFLRDVLHKGYTNSINWQSYKQEVSYSPQKNMIIMEELDIPELIAKTVNRFEQSLLNHYGELLTSVVRTLRVRNYSRRTEDAYLMWATQFLRSLNSKDQRQVSDQDVRNFLEYLALQRRVSPNTQKQALNALVFLFKFGFERELGNIGDFIKSKSTTRLPVVLSKQEVKSVMKQLTLPKHILMVGLLYGSGLRLMECIQLRVQDIDFDYQQIMVRNGKGFKDRVVPLPQRFISSLREQIKEVEQTHQADLA